jgi:hypothetical protein
MRRCAACVVALLALTPRPAFAYSVLAHEATIDVAWESTIRPFLTRRFPHSTAGDLIRARAYAYGGSVIQDLGYYPFGNRFFSNLLHYTRSGDFVATLIRDARTVDELAFALGALAHYTDDNIGHAEAVNRTVPLVFPKLGTKFGDTVTYVQARKQHVIVEFSFDVVQVAAGAYPSEAFRRFIGFEVSTALLERAFRETYGLEMADIFGSEGRALATYRYAVSQIIPALTEAAWRDKEEDIARLMPGLDRSSFVFQYRRADFEQDYGHDYEKPRLFARLVAIVYRIVPKVGPLKALSFKAPPPRAEEMFVRSFKEATRRFRSAVDAITAGEIDLSNTNFDIGRPSRHGEYALADDTYAELLRKLADGKFERVPVGLRRDVEAFYGLQPKPSTVSRRERKDWNEVHAALIALASSR